MKAYVIRSISDNPEQSLACVEREKPSIGPRHVLVRMRAATLNFRDLRIFRGQYRPRLTLPLVPLSDGVGVVEEVGSEVRRFSPGSRVAGTFFQPHPDGDGQETGSTRVTLGCETDGVLSEWVSLPESGLVSVPDHLSDEEAAALPCAGVTAWNALMEGDPVRPGDTVLIQGTGGVSIFALQFARLAGCRTIVLSRSSAKLERARKLGATETICTGDVPDWEKRVRDLTDGQGVDRIVEVTGGESLPRSLEAVRPGGQIVVIGVLSGVETHLSIAPILMKEIRLRGILVGDRELFQRMNRAISANNLIPVIDRTFPFSGVLEAYRFLDRGAVFGKLAIRIPGS